MNPVKLIIVSADDFGISEGVNLGILDCCSAGAVSSVSALAAGSAFRSGAEKLRDFPGIGVGAHLCLNDELPLSPAGQIPTLVRDGRFLPYRDMVLRLISGRLAPGEVYREWKLQIEALAAAGLHPSHLDTHNHIHLYPALFKVLVHLAEEYGIGAVRLPGCSGASDGGVNAANAAKFFLAARFPARSRELELRGIRHPGLTRGFFRSGGITAQKLHRWAALARPVEITEIITHPGRGVSRDCRRYAHWGYNWQAERDALINFDRYGGWKAAGARLCGYGEIPTACMEPAAPASKKISGVSVVIPAFNERENIAKTLSITKRYLKKNAADCEILVVDDMSTDGTGAEAERLLRGGEGRVIRTAKRAGYGAALRAGFDQAAKDRILYFDADYPMRIENIAKAFRHADAFDFVIGRRNNSWSEGPARFFYRRAYGALVRFTFKLKLSDVNFAFKLFSTSAWKSLRVTSNGSFIDAELMLEASRSGFSIKEIPVPLLARTFGRSRLMNYSNIAKILVELVHRFLINNGLETLRLYGGTGFFTRAHAAARLLLCPVGEIEKRLPRTGRILDFGCGIGVLSHMAALNYPRRKLEGVDIDARKISAARLARRIEGGPVFATAAQGEIPPGPYAAIIASDVLYLLEYFDQEKILAGFFKNLLPGGVLLIKETDIRPRWKHLLNLAEETLAVKVLGFTTGRGIFIRASDSYMRLLTDIGFQASLVRIDTGYLHPHVLYAAVKPSASGKEKTT